MKALFYTAPGTMELREVEKPAAGAGEVVLRVLRCGICGSDRHAYHGLDSRRVPPLVLGHEAVGVLDGEEKNAEQLFAVNPLITCGECPACAGGRENLCQKRGLLGMSPNAGAFAEYVRVPRRNLLPVPAGLPPAAAALAEPAACAWHAARLAGRAAARPLAELSALVLGGGAIGLLAAAALQIGGCRRITIADTNPLRRQAAAAAGGWQVTDGGNLPGGSYDIIIDAVGCEPTRAAASAAAAAGGVIAHIGLEAAGGGVDARRLTLQEITFIGVYTYTAADFAAALRLLGENAFGDTSQWREERPLADGATAFADLDKGTAPAKIILSAE